MTIKKLVLYVINKLALVIISVASGFTAKSEKDGGILIIRTDHLGDLILFSPFLKNITTIFPEKRISLLINEVCRSYGDGLQARGYAIAEIITINIKKFNRNFFYKVKFLWFLYKEGYSAVLNPVFSREQAGCTIVAATQASRRIGWVGDTCNMSTEEKQWYDKNFSELIPNPQGNMNEVMKYSYLFKKLGGGNENSLIPSTEILDQDRIVAKKIFIDHNINQKKFIVLCPGAAEAYKQWPIDRFAVISDFIYSLGFQSVICGTKHEKHLAQQIYSYCTNPIIDLTGKTDIFTLAAILSQATLFIGNDSGPVHLATSVKTPTICIMGGGHFRRFFPHSESPLENIVYNKNMNCYNDNWACCYDIEKGGSAPCIRGISVEMVESKISYILDQLPV